MALLLDIDDNDDSIVCYRYVDLSKYNIPDKQVIDIRESVLHNEDGPAYIDDSGECCDGTCNYWFYKGKYHRLDGPADDSNDYYYIDGQLYESYWKLLKILKLSPEIIGILAPKWYKKK